MEAAMEAHFFGHGANSTAPADERTSCHWCQIRSFATHKALPITIVNETGDGAAIPPHFRFIDRSVFGPGVTPASDEFRSGCQCADEEDCVYKGCQCLEEIASDDDSDGGDESPAPRGGGGAAPASATRKMRFAYCPPRDDRAGLLRDRILGSRQPIYECHEGCRCSGECPNRVVERGRKVPLQIFRTKNRGWGVRSTVDIKQGQFVDRYLGEIITPGEARRRREASSIAQRKDVYLFALDKFNDPDSLDPRLTGAPLEVDGEFMSGPTRFINHSCDPNMRIFARVGDHADKHVHDLALFAIKDIARGEELTFDYVDGLEEMESDARDENMQDEMTVCLCRSAKCRGFLW